MESGTTLADRFEIERPIGAGGMGVVYRARDRLDGAYVAVKLLHGQGVRDGERFAREATVLAGLRHPAIVRYVAHGTTPDGDRYLAMEWLEGETLEARLSRSRFAVQDAVALAARIADALVVAHRQGIVHRDLKPSNVFLPAGSIADAKLLDFGIARRVISDQRLTQTGAVVGTPMYMAPEQARGERTLDARADLFSLGCMLFECLAGRSPFSGENVMVVLAKICLEPAPPVESMRSDTPAELSDLVGRLLAKNPDERPADAAAVVSELATCAQIAAAAAPLRVALAATEAAEPQKAWWSLGRMTGGEQRVMCIVLAGPPRPPAADTLVSEALAARSRAIAGGADETQRLRMTTPTPVSLEGDPDGIATLVKPYGAQRLRLLDGSIVLTFPRAKVPTDQAVQAARAALALRDAVPSAPVVLCTGRAEVREAVPVGDVLDRAARLVGVAGPAAPVLLDEASAGLLAARFDLGPGPAGGFLRGERDIQDAPRTVLGTATTCVGRTRELGMLDSLFSACASDGIAQAVLVTAAAGVGKSRLRHEFLKRLRDRAERFELMLGRGEALRAGAPYSLLTPGLHFAFGITSAQAQDLRREKIRARVSQRLAGEKGARVADFLGEMVGVPFPDEGRPALRAARQDARLMADQVRAAWLDWLGAECTDKLVLLVLEDLHWADRPSVQLVDAALRVLKAQSLLVVALARPDVHEVYPSLWEGRDMHLVRLGNLTQKAGEMLAREVLGATADAHDVARLVERADGNAFFLEELCRGFSGGLRDAMPVTVLGMVQARLDALGEEAKRILRAASVFGQAFQPGGVAALLGSSAAGIGLAGHLELLTEREVVFPKGDRERPEYVFRHGILRDAAYGLLPDEDRTLGHRLAAQWLEDGGDTPPAVLAEHFELGGEPMRAVRWYHRAAEQALEGNDHERVIAIAAKCVPLVGTGEVAGRLQLLAAEAHDWSGDFVGAEGTSREAMRELTEGSPKWHAAASVLADALLRQGKADELSALAMELSKLTTPESQHEAAVASLSRASMCLFFAGRHDRAETLYGQVHALFSQTSSPSPALAGFVAQLRAYRALFDGNQGEYVEELKQAAEAFEKAGDMRNASVTRGDLGFAAIELGAYQTAEDVLVQARKDAMRMGLQMLEAVASQNLGLALARRGSNDQAAVLERSAIAALAAQHDSRLEGHGRAYLSMIELARGDLPIAEKEARTAMVLLAAIPARCFPLAVLARILLAQGRPGDGLDAASEAMKVLDLAGNVEEGESFVRLVYAEALMSAGQSDVARTAIRTARDRLAQRAARITSPAYRDSFLAIAENARTLALAAQWLAS